MPTATTDSQSGAEGGIANAMSRQVTGTLRSANGQGVRFRAKRQTLSNPAPAANATAQCASTIGPNTQADTATGSASAINTRSMMAGVSVGLANQLIM